MSTKRKLRRSAPDVSRFTLIEILMVCSLLAFLMAIMVAGYGIARTKIAESRCRSTIAKIATALESYKAKTGYYLQTAGQLSAFYIDTIPASRPSGSYYFFDTIDLEKMKTTGDLEFDSTSSRYYLVDPYGTPYQYRCPGTHNRMSFDIESKGADESITEDNINNWE